MNKLNRSDILPGPTALELARRPLLPVGILFVSTGISAASYFLAGATVESFQPWMYPMVGVMFLAFIWTLFRWFTFLFKAAREEKAGYTTTCNLSPKVPQVDYQTGEVLRAVGQPMLMVYTAQQRKGH